MAARSVFVIAPGSFVVVASTYGAIVQIAESHKRSGCLLHVFVLTPLTLHDNFIAAAKCDNITDNFTMVLRLRLEH
jgi:hypothetical protein